MDKAAVDPDSTRSSVSSGGGNGRPAREVGVLVLFDVDGTLLLSGGAGRSALKTALEAVYSAAGPVESYDFHGKTDPQIVVELLSAIGRNPADIRERLPTLWPVYLAALKEELGRRVREGLAMALPGVGDLLAGLEGTRGVSLGLLTGNIAPAAELKLAAAGVEARFEFGGYGSDSESRNEIARIAVERARALDGRWGEAHTVVIGDTPRDVEAARAISARAVMVATGRHSTGDLAAAGADVVFKDFRETEAVLSCLLGGNGSAPGAGASGGEGPGA